MTQMLVGPVKAKQGKNLHKQELKLFMKAWKSLKEHLEEEGSRVPFFWMVIAKLLVELNS